MLVTSCDLFIQSVSKIDLLLRCGGGVVGLGMLSSSEFTAGPIVLVWIAESEFVLKEHNMKHILTYCFPWSESCRGWKKAACWEYSWFPLHSCEEQNRSCFWNIKLTVIKRADHKILRYIFLLIHTPEISDIPVVWEVLLWNILFHFINSRKGLFYTFIIHNFRKK